MRPWRSLNTRGRILLICCIINVYVSVVYALDSNNLWLFSIFMALYCGLSTYSPKCDKE